MKLSSSLSNWPIKTHISASFRNSMNELPCWFVVLSIIVLCGMFILSKSEASSSDLILEIKSPHRKTRYQQQGKLFPAVVKEGFSLYLFQSAVGREISPLPDILA